MPHHDKLPMSIVPSTCSTERSKSTLVDLVFASGVLTSTNPAEQTFREDTINHLAADPDLTSYLLQFVFRTMSGPAPAQWGQNVPDDDTLSNRFAPVLAQVFSVFRHGDFAAALDILAAADVPARVEALTEAVREWVRLLAEQPDYWQPLS